MREPAQDEMVQKRLRSGFNQWLLEDTRHRQAFSEMETLWGILESPVKRMVPDNSPCGNESAKPDLDVSDNAWPPSTRPVVPQFLQRVSIAACFFLVVCITLGWQQDWMMRWQSDYITGVGEQTPVVMDDNSRITLNTDSAIATDYNVNERRVRLLKGEAWFNVDSGDKRPFIVDTGTGVVRVTGTQFNVRLVGSAAIVSLDEGRVELKLPSTASSSNLDNSSVSLAPGQQAVLVDNRISPPAPFDRTAVTAWLRGQFVFYNTPLSDVVATLNRHRHGRIVVTSTELNSLKVSGIFAIDSPDAALEVIANTLPIQQTRLTDYLVLIR